MQRMNAGDHESSEDNHKIWPTAMVGWFIG